MNVLFFGHKNLVNLIKNYDLTLEGPGLANIAAALATGPSVAQGEQFEDITLQTKSSTRTPAPQNKDQSQLRTRQPPFPITLEEQISSYGTSKGQNKTSQCRLD